MNAVQPIADASAVTAARRSRLGGLMTRLWPAVIAYSVILAAVILVTKFSGATDYVGPDNDDGMRLVEVRDFLAGQGWFDLMQYRLGLAGGTLMHWSRLIDLPIASLIRFFGLFAPRETAEALALAVWPVSLIVPAMLAMGVAGRRIGGVAGMHIALGLTAPAIYTGNRFAPGAIDHHNAQLALVATMVAMLVDRERRGWSYAVAGVAAAVAIAIGAETTPFVAVVCLTVALLWAWEGENFAIPARAFGLSLTIAINILFFATVPPRLYSMVTCDNLSLGYYSLAAIGSGLLLFSAVFASGLRRPLRFAALAFVGAGVLGAAIVIAPQCLSDPLGSLDPMLVELWLRHISEAQSLLALARTDPTSVGAFYAAGLFGIAVCIFRLIRRDRVQIHLVLLFLLATSWAIALVQVRGATFSNLLSILPLALLIIDVRRISNSDSENVAVAFVYVMTVLASVPAVWAVGGGLVSMQMENDAQKAAEPTKALSCTSKEALASLAELPLGLVSAPSEMGVPILRFTQNRVLSAPYHRDQGGMLTEMHIGLAKPQEAEAFLKGAGVTTLAFCPKDLQTRELAKLKPDGLYAELGKGNIPPYLEPLAKVPDTGVQFFRYRPTAN
ncbi:MULTISPECIES: hypothetical protein [Rhizobium]|uniref:hypothetical protein n=1 Tax=Rhizobium TaxID=379 RepID=UPI0007E9FEBE|nr:MULTISPECIES: hypothetical protein [Rhizobium]ANK89832.1 oligosaccharyl transferase-like protein [Rhizobium sp. N6212]ANK95859.1 oligosaccharyl transferase-like protein [Rhizobium sp. N621]ANL01887.1 oligosaccharyl transferase-like protein [Rhizobium esperanzae]ANL08015.1 oligosaccharyl transferase-like protein [Rhizobium sp. N1341]ANL20061.1 oligosaccharyl transferase-like protein [Rhizobium sp. N113]